MSNSFACVVRVPARIAAGVTLLCEPLRACPPLLVETACVWHLFLHADGAPNAAAVRRVQGDKDAPSVSCGRLTAGAAVA